MAEMLKERVKVVYTIGSAAEKIERQLQGVVKMVPAETLQVAVAKAAKAATIWRCGVAVAGLLELRPV